ncbi:MAG: glycyl-tRNA synthetase [Chloroflexota bacterium]|nr:glycyl-tRNA synthetase [Chloroflexota bacterium]
MQDKLNFQTIMMTLQQFWGGKGCLIWQPYYTQVGAGTMNPATVLRVLGPEPWNVAYVEPSIRPDDGRYGDNPYRMQQHYQFQVILKPDPGNPQELYLQSLEALGINPLEHDIRFVEDNWESPALGAWGLGWEVWLDGQEITQFTYFQQAGGINLDPVSVEITYGLERIAMALQGSYNFKKIQWSPNFTYGDVNYQAEYEHSRYYFEVADIERLYEMYDLFEKEANLALDQGLVLPAHDYILKCSHTFNVLDTRGAVGVTERQALFGRMRELSRRTSETYIAQREALGFPWLEKPSAVASSVSMEQPKLPEVEKTDQPADFLLEIGTEELPAADLENAFGQLQTLVPAMLSDLRLNYEAINVYATPRRLMVHVSKLDGKQVEITQEVKGPPADRAYDKDGQLTKAALGFARSKGVEADDLTVKEVDSGKYLTAVVHQPGLYTLDILPEKLVDLIAHIRFDKSMRWNASGVSFSRPIRWLAAMFGTAVVPFAYAGLNSDHVTRGLRFSAEAEHTFSDIPDYFTYLKDQGILSDPAIRKAEIEKQVGVLLSSVKAAPKIDSGLLAEVNNLVEAPTALLGNFNEEHLKLPSEVLVGVMKKHQRYFPVAQASGELMPHFITIRNGGKEHLEIVAHGNEEVVQARFADAAFFINEDNKHSLDDFIKREDTLTFHPKLGSMLDKTNRILKLTETLCLGMGLSKEETAVAVEAAQLCKADLVSKMVIEMTALQGTIGKYYALQRGKSEAVANAIEEHYQPRNAGDQSPASKAGLVVGLADRLDSLIGLFSAGMAPSGTKDPFGLRRAAIGLVQNLINADVSLDLQKYIFKASVLLPIDSSPKDCQDCLDFIVGRLEQMLLEEGYAYDAVKAVLAVQGANPAKAAAAIRELSEWIQRDDWRGTILPAYSRCVRITRKEKQRYNVSAEYFQESQEKALYEAVSAAQKGIGDQKSVDVFLTQLLPVLPAINDFFDAVLVMDEKQAVRENRLGLLQSVANLADGIVDLSKLEGF